MTDIVANGKTYTIEQLFGYGLYEYVTAGTGEFLPRWVAVHKDLIADSQAARDIASATLDSLNQASDQAALTFTFMQQARAQVALAAAQVTLATAQAAAAASAASIDGNAIAQDAILLAGIV